MPSDPKYILGVEREIVEEFLQLLRDKYPIVDEANHFIEHNVATSGINVAITNQRDALSHLCTILTRTDMTMAQKRAQIANAEEHLRRATIESYEIAVIILNDRVLDLLEAYKKEVLPLPLEDDPLLSSAPNLEKISSIMRQITDLRDKGRHAKGLNHWDHMWEEGVESFIKAFDLLKQLELIVEQYLIKAQAYKLRTTQVQLVVEQSRHNRRSELLHYLGIGLALGIPSGVALLRLIPWAIKFFSSARPPH